MDRCCLEHLARECPDPVGYRGEDVRRAAEQAERAVTGDRRHAELSRGTGNRDRAPEEQLPIVVGVAEGHGVGPERRDHVGARGEVLGVERTGSARDHDRRDREASPTEPHHQKDSEEAAQDPCQRRAGRVGLDGVLDRDRALIPVSVL